ncbi:hypothetical protein [Kitasatospora sp. NPDC101183]|uniref:hypothetical protein n=1 Tax=Kitasatospora sp. NPDC101183 TaxID=3364100 RepID=UPI003800272C
MSQSDQLSGTRQCASFVALPSEDVDHFNTVPRGAFLLGPRLRCDLARDHGGRHSALLQGVGYDLYWASWPEYLVELGPRCPVLGPHPGPDPDFCLLHEGHPGPHAGEDWF